MEDTPSPIIAPVSLDAILENSLVELKQQLIHLENIIISHKIDDVLVSISRFKEQTIDFLELLDTPKQSAAEVSPSDKVESIIEEANEQSKGSYPDIIIKISNHHYVPRVFHAQTIFTYKTD